MSSTRLVIEHKNEEKQVKSNLYEYDDLIKRAKKAITYIRDHTASHAIEGLLFNNLNSRTGSGKTKLLELILFLAMSLMIIGVGPACLSLLFMRGQFYPGCVVLLPFHVMTFFFCREIYKKNINETRNSFNDSFSGWIPEEKDAVQKIASELSVDLQNRSCADVIEAFKDKIIKLQDGKKRTPNKIAFLMGSSKNAANGTSIYNDFFRSNILEQKTIDEIFQFADLASSSEEIKKIEDAQKRKAKTSVVMAFHEKLGKESSLRLNFFEPMMILDKKDEVENSMEEIFEFAGLKIS